MVTRTDEKKSCLRAIEGGNLDLIEPTKDYGAAAGEILEAVMTNLEREITQYKLFMDKLPESTVAYFGETPWKARYMEAKEVVKNLKEGTPAMYQGYRIVPY
ncbi:MAG: hypothetical protein KAT28_01805 [Candidatus Aenigmarchaeota archaeon]|nr:hypothetical protein [Candidatus Aenigmarchaeota archaeon]